jgi:hypothetical protein
MPTGKRERAEGLPRLEFRQISWRRVIVRLCVERIGIIRRYAFQPSNYRLDILQFRAPMLQLFLFPGHLVDLSLT